MSTVRWGILSTARHGEKIMLPAFRQARDTELAAVASRDGTRAQTFAQQHRIPTSYSSYEALLDDPDIDAIYIPLPNNLHKEWAIKAAQAGKHVLCEKPIGLDAAEAEEMVAAFKQADRILSETFQWRHHPQASAVKELIEDGTIGEVRLVDAGFSFLIARQDDIRLNPDLGGGSLYDVGCYPVSLARYMLEAEPLAVTAQAHWTERGVDDRMVATLEFPKGVLAQINCGFSLPLRRYYEVVGDAGSLAVNRAYNPVGDRASEIVHYGDDRMMIETIRLDAANSYALMIEDFNRAVKGEAAPRFPADDAVKNMRVIDALYQSARKGGTVPVEG